MCRIYKRGNIEMGLKTFGGEGKKGIEKLKSSMVSRSKMKLWMIRATTCILLWTCLVQLTTLGEMWGPRVLKGWPSCFSHESSVAMDVMITPPLPARVLPPKRVYKNNGYLMVSCNGGLNQMRAADISSQGSMEYNNAFNYLAGESQLEESQIEDPTSEDLWDGLIETISHKAKGKRTVSK